MKKATWIQLSFLVVILSSCGVAQSKIGNNNFPLQREWSYAFNDSVFSVVASDNLIVVADVNRITGIEASTGKSKWKIDFSIDPDSRLFFSDRYLVAANSSKLVTIDRLGNIISELEINPDRKNAKIVAVSSYYAFVVRTPSWMLEVYNLEQGTKIWETSIGRGGVDIDFDSSKNIAYITTASFIRAYNANNGQIILEKKDHIGIGKLDNGILYYYRQLGNKEICQIVALDTQSFNTLWETTIKFEQQVEIYNLTVVKNKFLIIASDFGLTALSTNNGSQLWQSENRDSFFTEPTIIKNNIYARSLSTNMIFAISLTDGRDLGFLNLGNKNQLINQPEYNPILPAREFLIFPYKNTIYAYGYKQ